MDFSGFLIFPISPQFKREVEFESPWTGTIVCTATAIPAFLRMQDDGWFALLRMRYIDVDLTCFYTDIASVTDFRIE
jgi:hypothetical protein